MNGVCPELEFETNAEFQNIFNADYVYQGLLKRIADVGYMKSARGHNRFSIPSHSVLFPDVHTYTPMVRCKKLFVLKMLREMIWMALGMTNIAYLKEHNVSIWDNWIKSGTEVFRPLTREERIHAARQAKLSPELDEFLATDPSDESLTEWMNHRSVPHRMLIDGKLGPVYGAQWRAMEDTQIIFTGDHDAKERYKKLIAKGYVQQSIFEAGETGYDNLVMTGHIDQLGDALDLLDSDPGSARMVINAWNPRDLPSMALPPCHMMFQFVVGAPHHKSVSNVDHVLHMNAFQRSCDVALGIPFNWASYATLLTMVAACSKQGFRAGGLQYNMGDCHVYENQYGESMKKLERQMATELDRIAHLETVADGMADAPKLTINVPEELKAKWAGCKYYGTRYRFDELLNYCRDLPDDELLKVFDYSYDNYQPHVFFPVSI